MVALSFKRQFVEPIEAGRKAQTIRRVRADLRPHCREGQRLTFWVAIRSSKGFEFGSAICSAYGDVKIDFDRLGFSFEPAAMTPDWFFDRKTTVKEKLDRFAIDDGFENWQAMAEFWRVNHPGVRQFSGRIIRWRDFTPSQARRR